MKKRFLPTLLTLFLLLGLMLGTASAYNTGDDYPGKYKNAEQDSLVDEWRFYNRECTSFVAWCLNSRNNIPFTNQYLGASRWGHAKDWGTVARGLGITVDMTPATGAVAWWDTGAYGHVAWVSAVNGDSVTIEEYNAWPNVYAFQTRTVSKNDVSGFIHIADIQVNPSGSCGENVTWTYLTEDKTLVVSGSGAMANNSRQIPYEYSSKAIKIIIEDGVTTVGDAAFLSCHAVKNVVLPNSLVSIGHYAFDDCNSLTDLQIPTSVTSIGASAFRHCSGLTHVEIPSSVTKLGGYAFADCSSLTSAVIQSAQLSGGMFYNCTNLTNVTISASVLDVDENGPNPFDSCNNLQQIIVDGQNPNFFVQDGVLFKRNAEDRNTTTLICYPGAKSGAYVIPSHVKELQMCAFRDCKKLTSVKIPSSLYQDNHKSTDLGGWTFEGCTSLKRVEFDASGWGDGTGAMVNIGTGTFQDCTSLTSIVIPHGFTQTGGGCFSGCTNLTSITIPSPFRVIDDNTFEGCTSLTDIYFNGSKSDWDKIKILTKGNDVLQNVTIHYNSTGMGGAGEDPGPGPDIPEDISKIKINGKSIQSLFAKSSVIYDNDLALFAANLSKAAEDRTGNNILSYYRSLEWPAEDREIYQYGGDCAYSIACAKLSRDENLLVITARGSQTLRELFEDFASFGHRDFFGYTTNDIIYDFERDIMTGLNRFLTDHEYLEEKELKVLITGHSLGGAAANLNAARFTMFEDGGAWWSDLTEQSDIYCYTFGAINSLSNNSTEKSGFENIHNVYNILDSFGPNRCGNHLPSGLGRGYGKFGHMEWYSHNYETGWYIPFADSTNHLIENYIDSLNNGYVSCKKYSPFIMHGGGVWCPVDFKIYLEAADGPVLVGSITDNQIDEIEHPMVGLRVEGDKKYFYLPDNGSYTIELKGTDAGTMTYFAQDMDAETGEPIVDTGIVYQQVQLAADKQFYSDIKVEGDIASGILTEKVPLYVLDENGEPEKEVLPDGKGTEVPIETPPECDHSYTTSVTAPTCTERGYTTHTCSKCGDSYVDTYTAALGHSYGEWRTVTAATAAASGLKERFCIRCNDRQTQSIPATGGNTTSGSDNNSSSGGPSYSIEIPARVTGGTVKIAPTSASERQRVAVTVKANLGYELDKLTVTDSKGNELKLTGKGDGKYTFTMPDSKVTVNVSFAAIAEVPTAIVFTDVPSGAYYYDAVAWAVKKGVTSGASATMFSPDSNCTRAQIVTFLWRAAGSPVMGGSSPFTDVASGSYYYDAVQWAVAQGITAGTSATTFSPEAACTRGQAVTFLYRAAGSPVAGGSSAFVDVSDDAYYTNAVRWAVSKGVTAGTSTTTFGPDSSCTRAQIVSFLYRDRAN